jgi:hypothetical protein
MSSAQAKVKNQLIELLRMPTGDKLSLQRWYDEAQRLMRFMRDEKLEVPPFLPKWLSGAEARASDPLRAATENAELAKYLHTLNDEP